MKTDVSIPKVGESVTQGILSAWLKKEGEMVSEGEDLFELETDKAILSIPAPASGMLRIKVSEGSEVSIGQTVETLEDAKDVQPHQKKTRPGQTEPSLQKSVTEPGKTADETAPHTLSPAVHRLIHQYQLYPDEIQGSGKDGRILKKDVLEIVEQRETPSPSIELEQRLPSEPREGPRPELREISETVKQTRVKMTNIRIRTAQRLVASQRDSAHLTTFNEVNMEQVKQIRTWNSGSKDMRTQNNGFDVLIIGAGPGGYVAAIRAAQLGLNVACIDNMRNPGGTCLNIGCIPSKALLESSEQIVGSTEALNFERVPEKLVIVGAGAIGLELGSVWSRLGAEVTFIELMPEIAPGMDAQLSRTLRRALTNQGMSFHLSTRVTHHDKKEERLVLYTEDESGTKKQIIADKVLVAAGRTPAAKGLGIDNVGVDVEDKSGAILVNGRFQTRIDGIYAIGDLIGPPMVAHKAEEEGIACAEIIAGLPGCVNYRTVPRIIYTSPEIATVGITEMQAKEAGKEVNVGVFRFRVNGRALTRGDTEGFVKIVADKKTDELLGTHIVGHYASELISEAVTVMEFGGSAEDIARTVHAHPTLSEAVREAALAVDGRQIHALPVSAGTRTSVMSQQKTD